MPSKTAHNRPHFFSTSLAVQTVQKQKSRTTKSPLMQDWGFRLGQLLITKKAHPQTRSLKSSTSRQPSSQRQTDRQWHEIDGNSRPALNHGVMFAQKFSLFCILHNIYYRLSHTNTHWRQSKQQLCQSSSSNSRQHRMSVLCVQKGPHYARTSP